MSSKVVKPGQEYQGKSYNVLASEWSNWLAAGPIATNPAFDPDGGFCDRNQAGDVWFLASTFGVSWTGPAKSPPARRSSCPWEECSLSFSPEFPAAGDPCLQMATDLEKVRCDVNDDVPRPPAPPWKPRSTESPWRTSSLTALRASPGASPCGSPIRPSSPISDSLRDRSPRWPTGTSCS